MNANWSEFIHMHTWQGEHFCNLLEHIGDNRANIARQFKHEVVNCPWSVSTEDPDSGVSVVQLMRGVGENRFQLDKLKLDRVIPSHHDLL